MGKHLNLKVSVFGSLIMSFAVLMMTTTSLAAGSQARSATTIESGLYKAVDVETKQIVATLEVRKDNTLNFKVNSPEFTMPEPGCEGVYQVNGNTFLADLTCPLDFLSEVHVEIDITNVTPEKVSAAAGVDVSVVIDAISDQKFLFNLRKIN